MKWTNSRTPPEGRAGSGPPGTEPASPTGSLANDRVVAVGRRRDIDGVAKRAILSVTLDADAAARTEAATTPAGDGRRLQITWDGETVSVPVVMGTLTTAGGIMADTATLDEIERVLRGRVD